MIKVKELYEFLSERLPAQLSCEWDNDGMMCVPDSNRTVKKVLVCLDVNMNAVDYAIENGIDCIVSHHPLVFKALKGIDDGSFVCRRLIKLIKNDISVLSFHTRLDVAEGGVNDVLSNVLGLKDVTLFSDVGRMGCLKESMSVRSFGKFAKDVLSADRVICVDAGREVKKIAVVGGSGKGYINEAKMLGCDTFITGEMPFDCEHEAKECGVNLVCCGHYFTENIVCSMLEELIGKADERVEVYKIETNPSFCL